jgi:hypothetical protein
VGDSPPAENWVGAGCITRLPGIWFGGKERLGMISA